jgi:D-glycero-D-manno-heptose 1,7-bisphosphate phosphatase
MSEGHERDRVVILDRDGTIVIDRGYLKDPAGLEFAPGAALGLKWLFERGYRLVIVTNQSGVGRGFFPYEAVLAMNARLTTMVERAGAKLAGIYVCPHAPDAGCTCRKPALGLFERAAADLGFDPVRAVVVGDKASDVEFGRRAGAKTILIAPHSESGADVAPDVTARDMLEAAYAVPSLCA